MRPKLEIVEGSVIEYYREFLLYEIFPTKFVKNLVPKQKHFIYSRE